MRYCTVALKERSHISVSLLMLSLLVPSCGFLGVESLSNTPPDAPSETDDDDGGVYAGCNDGILNGNELRIDCGGQCPACTTCTATFSSPIQIEGIDLEGDLYGPSLSRDGLSLFFSVYQDDKENLYEARRSKIDTPFEDIAPITELNTDFLEGSPFLTHDGLSIYFFSTRQNETTRDIWSAARLERDGPFEEPILMFWLNSEYNDQLPCLTLDGRYIMFASDRLGSQGSVDLFASGYSNRGDYFDLPTNVQELNSPYLDTAPALSNDGNTVYFISDRQGNTDIWTATRADRDTAFDTPTPFTDMNTEFSELDVSLSPDEQTLLFASNRDGESTTLWQAVRECP